MKPTYSFVIILVIVSLCLFGVFHLIFPEHSEMMIWCTVSGIVLISTVLGGIFLTSSKESIDVKNTSSLWVLNIASSIVFIWTLVFVFLVGDYSESTRSMNGLYIGYLIIISFTSILFVAANRGTTVAQSHSDEIQQQIVAKDDLLHILACNLPEVEELFNNPRASEVKEYKKAMDLLRRMPNSTIRNANDLHSKISGLSDDIDAKDVDKVVNSIFGLTKYLKSI